MSINTGGPVFPVPAHENYWGENVEAYYGMTLRDYFAAQAMQGLLANPEYMKDIGGTDHEKTARLAYVMAYAMLMAREAA